MKSIYNAAEYPEGVLNPYTPAVHPYPSFQHGPDYTRPYFGMPYVRQPFNVLSGLGEKGDQLKLAIPVHILGPATIAAVSEAIDRARECGVPGDDIAAALLQMNERAHLQESIPRHAAEAFVDYVRCSCAQRSRAKFVYAAIGALAVAGVGYVVWRAQ